MRNRGFTLLIAIIIMGTLLLIAGGIVSLAVRQAFISSSGRESQAAFYAADTGLECALYWDVANPSGQSAFSPFSSSQISCNNQTALVGGTDQSTFSFNFLPDPYCAVVTVAKSGDGSGITASDASGNGNTGSLVGDPSWVDGQLNGALNFDGVNDYINITDNSVLDLSGNMTVSAWVKAANTTNKQHIVSRWGNPYNYQLFTNGDCTGGTAFGFSMYNGATRYDACANTTVNTNWHFVTGTFDGSNVRIYVDSVLKQTTPTTGSPQYSGTVNLHIGADSTPGNFFNGIIDDVRIYNIALNQQQIQNAMGNSVAPSPIAHWKFDDGEVATTIESRGYNTCNNLNPRRVERAIRAIY